MTAAQLVLADAGPAATAAPPTRRRLSRYPTRTAPAVPGHAHTRVRQLPAARTLPGAMGEPLARIGVDAVGGRAGPCAQGAAGQDVGGRGRWRR
jgi:hypothetical protein